MCDRLVTYYLFEGCYYSGHLERDTEACVGMTGCIGSEDVEFTILSDHATDSGSYKWSKNGSVELIPIPKFHKVIFVLIKYLYMNNHNHNFHELKVWRESQSKRWWLH